MLGPAAVDLTHELLPFISGHFFNFTVLFPRMKLYECETGFNFEHTYQLSFLLEMDILSTRSWACDWCCCDWQTEEQREDFGNLPPTQQRKQLTSKLESLNSALTKETSERYW